METIPYVDEEGRNRSICVFNSDDSIEMIMDHFKSNPSPVIQSFVNAIELAIDQVSKELEIKIDWGKPLPKAVDAHYLVDAAVIGASLAEDWLVSEKEIDTLIDLHSYTKCLLDENLMDHETANYMIVCLRRQLGLDLTMWWFDQYFDSESDQSEADQ